MNYKMEEKDRLTTRTLYKGISLNPDGSCSKCSDCYKCNVPVVDCPRVDNALIRLAYYEDLDTQGRLPKLPCAVGDIVYRISKEDNKIYQCSISSMECILDYFGLIFQFYVQAEFGTIVFYESDIGETVFLTYEEAERKLKEFSKND